MNEQSGNSGQLQGDMASSGDVPYDVTDPWRGLYRAERLRANGDGDLYHPDLPSWPDDREDALDELVHAQGFDFQIVTGDFSDEAIEDGDELYWQEMRAWNPEAPEGDWRLAWKGDTEDGPYAWFVRPMALRPEPEAIAARQPVGQEPVAWQWRSRIKDGAWDAWENGRYDSEPAPFMDVEHRALYTDPPAPAAEDRELAAWRELADHVRTGVQVWPDRYTDSRTRDVATFIRMHQAAPAAVPVDVLREAAALADAVEKNGVWDDGRFHYNKHAASELQTPLANLRRALATHPQPTAAKDVPELFVQWLEREMPAGTIIGKPAWWAPKLARALRSAERGVLGGCNG
ncbi:hypothetical protein LL963_16210 [Xanthomonas campestris pv. esculenti]|nr:hypothetical protein [Xanthomonas campestris pv. esculenti]